MLAERFPMVCKGLRKAAWFAGSFITYCIPRGIYRRRLPRLLASMTESERQEVMRRTDYYNRMGTDARPTPSWRTVGGFRYPKGKRKFSTYFFDLYRSIRYFAPGLRCAYLPGDVTEIPGEPTIVKSRPLVQDGSDANSVLSRLNTVRHFYFPKDSRPFRSKKNMLVSRNAVYQPHRRKLLEMYFGHPMCDLGQINPDTNLQHPEWHKEYLTIPQQLEYKFVSCIEGNDVATNLKWVMASNSLAVMPRPQYETWFMEGTLIPDYHYVEIKPDYSDLIEKMQYYIDRPEEAEAIIRHAHEYVDRFRNRRIEKLTQLCVLQKYFRNTGQI